MTIVALSAGLARIRPVVDPDTGWHLRQAAETLAAGWFRYPEVASFTKEGVTFENVSWGGQLILALMHHMGGVVGLTLVPVIFAGLCAALVYMLAQAAAPQRPMLAVLIASFSAAASNWRFETKPQVVGLCALVGSLLLARAHANCGERSEPAGSAGRWKLGAALLALGLVWAHSHPSYVLLPALIAIGFLDGPLAELPSRLKDRAPSLAILVFVPILGPAGFHAFSLVSEHAFGDATAHIAEMRPMKAEWLIPRDLGSFAWLDALIAVGLFRAIRRGRARLDDLAYAALGCALAFTHHRFRDIWAILLVPLAARSAPDESPKPWDRAAGLASIAVLPLMILGSDSVRADARGFGVGIDPSRIPVSTAKVLSDHHVKGRVFNHFDDGGWLSFLLPREAKIAIDGRTPSLFGDELYFLLRRAHSEPAAFALLDQTYPLELAIVAVEAPLCGQLTRDPAWRPVYLDETRATFARPTAVQTLPGITTFDPCAPERSLSSACGDPEKLRAVRVELARLESLDPSALMPAYVALHLESLCGDPATATRLATELRSHGPRSPRVLSAIARVTSRSDLAAARELAHRAVEYGGGRDARLLRGRLALAASDFGDAIEDLLAVTLELDDLAPAEVRLDLARALAGDGRTEQAIVQARRAFWSNGNAEARRLVESLGGAPGPAAAH